MASSAPDHPPIDYKQLKQTFLAAKNDKELFQLIVNAPLEQYKVQTALLFLGIIVLRLIDKSTGMINHIAMSHTELAENITAVTTTPLPEISLPLVDNPQNITVQTVLKGKPRHTSDWQFLFTPVLSPEQAAINQASAGIAYSAIYPFQARDGGALIFNYFQYPQAIGEIQEAFMKSYTRIVSDALSR